MLIIEFVVLVWVVVVAPVVGIGRCSVLLVGVVVTVATADLEVLAVAVVLVIIGDDGISGVPPAGGAIDRCPGM